MNKKKNDNFEKKTEIQKCQFFLLLILVTITIVKANDKTIAIITSSEYNDCPPSKFLNLFSYILNRDNILLSSNRIS